MPEPICYSCGCVNTLDLTWSVLRSISKCDVHRQEAGRGGLSHYIEMGCIVEGVPQHAKYIREFTQTLEEMGAVVAHGDMIDTYPAVLAIGCGLAMYAPLWLSRGYEFVGIEPDVAAAAWAASTFDVEVLTTPFEAWNPDAPVPGHPRGRPFGVVMAAHVVEHMTDAPAMLAKMLATLVPRGVLYLIIPDDTDPVNPDHLWFFTEANLRSTLERVGFVNIRTAVRRRIERENFIYAVAEAP